MFDDIRDFHEKFFLEYDGKPRSLDQELENFRTKFMKEELDEYVAADNLEKKLDALVDLVYVALGTAYLHGFPFEEAWRRVHEANMKKVRAKRATDSKRGSTFDVIKPDGWTPPDLSDLVNVRKSWWDRHPGESDDELIARRSGAAFFAFDPDDPDLPLD